MDETHSIGQTTQRPRLPFIFLLGIMALAGYFWNALNSVLGYGIVIAASSQVEDDSEFASDLLRWPITMSAAVLIVVTVLLALWMTVGERLQRSYPRLAMILVIVAILPHVLRQLLFAYFILVHDGV